MAEIVGVFGAPHSPFFPALVGRGGEPAAELDRLWGTMAEHLSATNPDVLLFITSDHYNNFWETFPTFAIGVAESTYRTMDYPDWPAAEVPVPKALAEDIHSYLVHADFDVARVQEFGLDHTIAVPLGFMAGSSESRVLPVFINGHMRALPSATRCAAFGHAVGEAVAASSTDERVAIIATGSFSLEVGGPRMSETQHIGVPAPGWVQRTMELLGDGDLDQLIAESTDKQLWDAGNAGGETLLWIAALSTIDARPPVFLEDQPQFGHGYGAWPVI